LRKAALAIGAAEKLKVKPEETQRRKAGEDTCSVIQHRIGARSKPIEHWGTSPAAIDKVELNDETFNNPNQSKHKSTQQPPQTRHRR
jgi:hypothetical protein